jgi:predicted RNA binding protein YcfA (HicA-like mRNA interferase family)
MGILVRHGFAAVRQHGSHVIMQRRDGDSTVTVPVPDHRRPLASGTLRSIINRSRLPRTLFEEPS